MTGLWISPTRYHDFASGPARDLLTEVATREAAGADIVGWLGVMPDPDPVLIKRGDDAQVLEELTSDDQVTMAMQQRKLGTLEKGDYQLSAGAAPEEDPDPAAEQLRDDLWADLERIDLYNLMSQVLDAPFFGYTPVEIIWKESAGRLRIHNLKVKPREWFGFDPDGAPLFLSQFSPSGEPCHPFKFNFARHFQTAKNPYGLRLLSRCLWPVAFKRGGVQWWTKFMERFGQPWVVGKAWNGASKKDRDDMLSQLAAMVNSATAVLSSGSEVDIHEATGKSGDLHRAFVRQWDSAISKVLMGQTLTADLTDVGARAASETHYDVLDDFRAADERIVKTFFDDLGWIYAQVNAPDVLSPTWGWNEPEDRAELAEQAKRLKEAGVKFRKPYFIRRFDLAEDEFDVEGDTGAAPEPDQPQGTVQDTGQDTDPADNAGTPGAFASAEPNPDDPGESAVVDHQEAIDAMLAKILPEATEAAQERSEAIAAMVARADSFEAIQKGLAELLPEIRGGKLTDIMQRALLAADMYGRLAVKEEADAD